MEIPTLINLIWDRVIESMQLCPANGVRRMGRRERRLRARSLVRSCTEDVIKDQPDDVKERVREIVREEFRATSNRKIKDLCDEQCC